MREITVITHRRPEETADTLRRLAEAAAQAGATLRLDPEETQKHATLEPGPAMELNAPLKRDVDLCIVLGGDGTILRALQIYAGTGVAVFAINFGEIGFLATVERSDIDDGIRRALSGDFELLRLPAIVLGDERNGANGEPPAGIRPAAGSGGEAPAGIRAAINDVAIHRKVGERVADIAYTLEGEEVGSVRCDGLVVSTPAGSTGYNLANGGPVMAWGVAGFVVSFIAPHSLTARALVVAPDDKLTIHNRSHEPLDVALDGRPIGEIPAGETIEARFVNDVGTIAQVPGTTFYRRLREKFGRLAS
ncbi:MAG: kinase [Solirubrobacterales bacterium]|nr:kinase [Solirubrobacterales bacterium]